MSTLVRTLPTGPQWILRDSLQMVRRALKHTMRQPEMLVFSTIQPVMFVLLFRYVFGGAIKTGGPYADYLMPGIFVQTTVFGSMLTGIGLANDLNNGIIDRFRSMPMSRSAVLVGRTVADTVRNVFIVALMLLVGVLTGYRPHGGALGLIGGCALIIVFGFAFSWVSAFLGIAIRNPEAVQSAGFIWVFPLTFVSSAFVPVDSMPWWLHDFAKVNPFTIAVDAARQLMAGPQEAGEFAHFSSLGGTVSLNVVSSLVWAALILAVFIPLAVHRYRRA